MRAWVKMLGTSAGLAAIIALPLTALAYLIHAFIIILATGNYMPEPEPGIHLAGLAIAEIALMLAIYRRLRR